MPAGKSGTTYSPWLVLVTVRDNAVPGLVAVTWASATTAPDWSLTTPRIVPLVTAVCEYAGTASNNVAAQVARNRYPNRFIFLLSLSLSLSCEHYSRLCFRRGGVEVVCV